MQVNRKETFRDGTLSGGEMTALVDGFIAHRSPKRYLVVGGNTYTGVRGVPPHHLKVPGSDRIVFATRDEGAGVTIYVVESDGSREMVFPAGGTSFGSGIGSPAGPGNYYSDSILSANNDQIVLMQHAPESETTLVLDLKEKRIRSQETVKTP